MRTMTVVVLCERIVRVANSGRGRRENIQKAFVTVTQIVTQVGSISPYRPYLSEIRTGMTTWPMLQGRCRRLRVPQFSTFSLYHTLGFGQSRFRHVPTTVPNLGVQLPWKLISPEHSPHCFRTRAATPPRSPTSTTHD